MTIFAFQDLAVLPTDDDIKNFGGIRDSISTKASLNSYPLPLRFSNPILAALLLLTPAETICTLHNGGAFLPFMQNSHWNQRRESWGGFVSVIAVQ